MASESQQEIGHSNVHFAGSNQEKSSSKSRKRLNWNKVCWTIYFVQKQSGVPVNREILFKILGLDLEEDYERFQKGTQRKRCIKTVEQGIFTHDNFVHDVSRLSRKFGHSNRGVGQNYVQFEQVACDFPDWFNPLEEFEIHAEVRLSPKNVPLVPTTLRNREFVIEWSYCDIRFSFPSQRIMIEMIPKYDDKGKPIKYGLNLERYKKYINEVEKQLKFVIGYAPLLLLDVEKFDLQQDHDCKKYDNQHRNKLVYNYLGLQEYPIVRPDKKGANHRREANFLSKDGVFYASESQEVLSVNAEKLVTLVETNKMIKTNRLQNEEFSKYQKEFFIHSRSFQEDVANFNKLQQDKFDSLDQNISTSLQVIAGSTRAIEENTTSLNEAIVSIDFSLQGITDILYELNEKHDTWREIDRQTKLDILKKMSTMDMTIADSHQMIQDYFEVSYQALWQFWNYWEEKYSNSVLDIDSRTIGHSLKKKIPSSEIIHDFGIKPNDGVSTCIIKVLEKIKVSTVDKMVEILEHKPRDQIKSRLSELVHEKGLARKIEDEYHFIDQSTTHQNGEK